jgi:hypothetical protein
LKELKMRKIAMIIIMLFMAIATAESKDTIKSDSNIVEENKETLGSVFAGLYLKTTILGSLGVTLGGFGAEYAWSQRNNNTKATTILALMPIGDGATKLIPKVGFTSIGNEFKTEVGIGIMLNIDILSIGINWDTRGLFYFTAGFNFTKKKK